MEDLKNCKITNDNKLIIKMVKMGMDYNKECNHRIRGIVPTDQGHYVFVEFLLARRPDIKYFSTSIEKNYYNNKYKEPEYVFLDFCFRVDSPIDFFDNYSKEYKRFNKKGYPDLKYTNENITKVLQQLNKNICGIELVDEYYIDDYCNEMKFYKLYDERLNYEYKPIKIKHKYGNTYKVDFEYKCEHKNMEIPFIKIHTRDITEDELKKKYGKELVDSLLKEYEEKLERLKESLNRD